MKSVSLVLFLLGAVVGAQSSAQADASKCARTDVLEYLYEDSLALAANSPFCPALQRMMSGGPREFELFKIHQSLKPGERLTIQKATDMELLSLEPYFAIQINFASEKEGIRPFGILFTDPNKRPVFMTMSELKVCGARVTDWVPSPTQVGGEGICKASFD